MNKKPNIRLKAMPDKEIIPPVAGAAHARADFEKLGVSFASKESFAATLPFSAGDVTSGSESELQAVVCGAKDRVDLPLFIEQSNFFANMMKRAASGEAPKDSVANLEKFIAGNSSDVWENSWVRFPRRNLTKFAQKVLEQDLLADKKKPSAGRRSDIERFLFKSSSGEEMLRVPISYLIKLALADVIGYQRILPELIRSTGARLMEHFLNDNTSPETFSFNVMSLTPENGMGKALASEKALRFLVTQLLVMYANQAFGIAESGQEAMVYFAPHPPVRQKELNELVSDTFYRELFMSPCLSGWDKGEEKFRYMQLCHKVLSRSQLNAVAKLRDAGIIQNNLVVMPNLSNISLANNGTHISIGSRRLTQGLADKSSGFTTHHEKYYGNLATKISEHFLPLFVGTYSAAPLRLAFTDFHPEKALGFLAHELDFTHLRMLWRRWKKKADLAVFGQPLTPFGPQLLDNFLSFFLRLKGDFVPDYRLVDYLVSLLSTEQSPGLDGQPGNSDRLRKDLADMGVFDEQMSVYLLYKQREFAKMGFSGFEGRYYSLFENFTSDMGQAADLQTLITAAAYKYIANGTTHHEIPDTPSVESERRQIIFGAAIGIPTFFVKKESGNLFMEKILKKTAGIRASRRYPGYQRVQIDEYCKALIRTLRDDAADLIEMMGLQASIVDLELRISKPEQYAASGKLTSGILAELNAKSPLSVNPREFNTAAEQFYRTTLRKRHMNEAFRIIHDDCSAIIREQDGMDEQFRNALRVTLQGEEAVSFLRHAREDVLHERATTATLKRTISFLLLKVYRDEAKERKAANTGKFINDPAPVYRAG